MDQYEGTNQHQYRPHASRRSWRIGLLVNISILLVFVPIGWFLGLIASLGGIACSDSEQDTGICAPGMEGFVVLLIPSTAIFGIILVGVLGSIWIKKHRSPNPWHALAWVLVLCSCVVSFGVGWGTSSQGPSPEHERKEEQQQKKQDQRTLEQAKQRSRFPSVKRDVERLHSGVLDRLRVTSHDAKWEWHLSEQYWSPDPTTTCGVDGRINKRTIQLDDHDELIPLDRSTGDYTKLTGKRWQAARGAFTHEGKRLGFTAHQQTIGTIPEVRLKKHDLRIVLGRGGPSGRDRSEVSVNTACHFR